MNYDIYTADAWGMAHRTGELRSIDDSSYEVYRTDTWGQLHRSGQLRAAGDAGSGGSGCLVFLLLPLLALGALFHHEPSAENVPYRAPQTEVVDVQSGPSQAEKEANWQQMLDLRAASRVTVVEPAPAFRPMTEAQPARAPRAELVALPHHHS